MRIKFCLITNAAIASIALMTVGLNAQENKPARHPYHKQPATDTAVNRLMSPMGRLAQSSAMAARAHYRGIASGFPANSPDSACTPFDDSCGDPGPGLEDLPSGSLAETSIAIDVTGQHIVLGYNDLRGLRGDVLTTALSASGFSYSDDGGKTFTDGGQLPNTMRGTLGKGGPIYPQVFGDPDVKYVPGGNGCQFVYSSILDQGYGTAPLYTSVTQTMAIHRSTDCGHTWTGPFEVTAASNPNGLLVRGTPVDGADKEYIDVNPDTGRVIISWTNFTSVTVIPGSVQILTSYSDDIITGNPPTWSAPVILDQLGTSFGDISGSVPRFAGNGSGNTYVAYTAFGARGLDIYVVASPNNGQDFAPPVRVNRAPFIEMDYVLGNDRVHNFPSMAVDKSSGSNQGNVYVVYANNSNGDGADIAFSRSIDGGASFSIPVLLNSNPGYDRAQWFPYVTVDSSTGRVSVVYYDQGSTLGGDLTELSWTYSDDGGVNWSKPSPLSPRPFHAGYGNDTSQPNLGDYIGAVARAGSVFAAYATTPVNASFADGEAPSPDGGGFPYPNVTVQKGTTAQLPVSLGKVTLSDSGANGYIDPGETIKLQIPLRSYAANPLLRPSTITGATATLSTATMGVTIVKGTSPYGGIAPAATGSNSQDFVIQTSAAFVPGTTIEFSLAVTSPQGSTVLPFSQYTGTPVPTQIFAENFDSATGGLLPPGWTASHAAPALPMGVTPVPAGYIVPWTTSKNFCAASSNGLYHANANDGPITKNGQDNTRFERAFSPLITVPDNAQYVTLDFDICTNTEDDPEFAITAYDGVVLRITDMTDGRTLRSSTVEAFADSFQTGSSLFYPKHLPRNSSASYLQDLSAWGGDSQGFQHVSLRLPGMAGSTVQMRWEFTQDSIGTCADVRYGNVCGVIIDNIVMNSVASK